MERPGEKPREFMDREVQDSPVLLDLLERARESGQTLVTYQGTIFAITPVEDITHTFTPEELEEFAAHYAAADDPNNHLTVEQECYQLEYRVGHCRQHSVQPGDDSRSLKLTITVVPPCTGSRNGPTASAWTQQIGPLWRLPVTS